MMNLPPLSPAPDSKTAKWGFVYWAFSFALLGSVIALAAALMGIPITDAQLNMVYYLINFCAAVAIFRKFLAENWRVAMERIFPTVYYAILAYLGSQLLTGIVGMAILRIDPDFFNVNDESIQAMLTQDPALMVLGTVLLAPIAEEVFYRGLFFRKLYDVRPWVGYAVSMAVFAAIHMVGYIGTYPPLQLLLGCAQYLPAGYCLCWCYRQTGTILSPILMHILFNASSIFSLVR